jgi:hypothetical protein
MCLEHDQWSLRAPLGPGYSPGVHAISKRGIPAQHGATSVFPKGSGYRGRKGRHSGASTDEYRMVDAGKRPTAQSNRDL